MNHNNVENNIYVNILHNRGYNICIYVGFGFDGNVWKIKYKFIYELSFSIFELYILLNHNSSLTLWDSIYHSL